MIFGISFDVRCLKFRGVIPNPIEEPSADNGKTRPRLLWYCKEISARWTPTILFCMVFTVVLNYCMHGSKEKSERADSSWSASYHAQTLGRCPGGQGLRQWGTPRRVSGLPGAILPIDHSQRRVFRSFWKRRRSCGPRLYFGQSVAPVEKEKNAW